MAGISLLILDMGGVVVQRHSIARELGAYLGWPEGVSFFDDVPGMEEPMRALCAGEIDEGRFWKEYARLTGRKDPYDGSESLFTKFFHPVVDPAMARLIGEAKGKGLRVVCGTNTLQAHYDWHASHGQYGLFDAVYASQLMHLVKPDPAFWKEILRAEGADASSAFFTDDSRENVDGALSVGLHAFLFRDAEGAREDLRSLGLGF